MKMLKNNARQLNNMKISYDQENDVLYVDNGGRIEQSIPIDNIIMDISEKWNVVALEIINASKELEIPKENIKKIKHAKIKTIKRRDAFGAAYILYYAKGEKAIEKGRVAIPILA